MNISVELGTVNVVIFARGNFAKMLARPFKGRGGLNFTIKLLFP